MRRGLLMKFALVFLLFSAVTLLTSGIATYLHQSRSYQADQEQKLQQIANYLAVTLQADGRDFPMYQSWFVAHHDEMNVPVNFTADDIQLARAAFENAFIEAYPNQVLGAELPLSALNPEVQMAYAVWSHEYYLNLFEKAASTFGLTYAYYLVPTGEAQHMYWMLDAVREERGETGMINLGVDVLEPLEAHQHMWEAWNTGLAPSGYDVYDDSYELGMTYAWYTPLYINGEKLGLIGTEVGIADYNRAILLNTMRQLGSIAVILLAASSLTLLMIDRLYITKIRHMARAVGEYAKHKDPAIAGELAQTGGDELCFLSNQTGTMIRELDRYMKNLVAAKEELSHTKEQVDLESQLARRDPLTGARNRVAYEEEVKRLSWQMLEGETKFGFVVADVNFLKRINDTYGHNAGNQAIQYCCAALCMVFSHSMVFRIGGDEFAVILLREDYEQIEEKVAEFLQVQQEECSEPWKRLSAAIGYALYDPDKDDCIENVFSRADKAMYRKKREMQALR